MSSRVLSSNSVPSDVFIWRPATAHVHGESSRNAGGADRVSGASELEAQVTRQAEDAYKRGRQEGLAEGERKAAAALEPFMVRLARTIEDLARTRPNLRREAEQDVVRLAVAIARKVLHRELVMDPAALVGMVKAAIETMDSRELSRVRAHPEDASPIAEELKRLTLPKQVEVIGDATLERGAVIFETTRGVVDASVSSQLDEIERGLADMVGRKR